MLSTSKSKKSSTSGKESGEVMERLKLLSAFQSVDEFQAFMANVVKEKDLKSRIKDLGRYRKNGVRKISQSAEFDSQLKIRRINRKRSEKRRQLLQQSSAAAAAS